MLTLQQKADLADQLLASLQKLNAKIEDLKHLLPNEASLMEAMLAGQGLDGRQIARDIERAGGAS